MSPPGVGGFNELLEQHHSLVIMSPQDKLRGRGEKEGEGRKDDVREREKGREGPLLLIY